MQFHLLLFSKILVNGFEFVTPTLTQRAADQNEQCCGKLQNEEILTIFYILLISGAIDVDDFSRLLRSYTKNITTLWQLFTSAKHFSELSE